MLMDSNITVGIVTSPTGLHTWGTAPYGKIPRTRTEDDHSEGEEWCQENRDQNIDTKPY